MSLFKKTILTPFVLAVGVWSVQAHAAPINHTVQLSSFVPTADFYVLPSDSSWIGETQALSYNINTQEMASLVKTFDAVHSAGSISAQLLAPAYLAAGANNVVLDVKFNGKSLTTTAQTVLTAAEAATVKVVNLEIIPTRPATGYESGSYLGNVQLSFDAVI